MPLNRTLLVAWAAFGAGMAPLAAQPSLHCDQWNTEEFFRAATPAAVNACLAAGADLDAGTGMTPHSAGGKTPLHHAAESARDPAVVRALLAAGANVNVRDGNGRTPMHFANPVGIEALLAAGADVNALSDAGGFTPLHTAFYTSPAGIELLLAAGADVDARDQYGRTPLYYVARDSDSLAPVKSLLVAGANVQARDQSGHTPLHYAVKRDGIPAVFDALLAAGADVNARDDDGRTPAFDAAENPGAFEWLLAAGTEVNARDNAGNTLLHVAAGGEDPAIAELLLAAGADANARAAGDTTPLHEAAMWSGWVDSPFGPYPVDGAAVVEALLAAGAGLDARDDFGFTPLHWAARLNRNPAVVELLLAAGADVDARNEFGESPLDSAQFGFSADAIRKAGSSRNPTARAAATDGDERPIPEAAMPDRVETLRGSPEGPELVVVPAGRFRMGCVSRSPDCDSDEWPVHEVEVESFALGRYEVTFKEYDRFAEATGRERPEDAGWGGGRRPVIHVSWKDAVEYADWLSAETGERYRLPTEAEWEYAARAGTTTPYSWGQEVGRNRANCHGCGSRWDDSRTAPIGSFEGNAWGLHDMHGNVWEWVRSCSVDDDDARRVGSARTVDTVCDGSLRGGSWNNHPWDLRSANRGPSPALGRHNVGFRVARSFQSR